jgi:hypothetical protein
VTVYGGYSWQVKVDKESKLLWKKEDGFHHDLKVRPNGNTHDYRARLGPRIRFNANGKQVWRFVSPHHAGEQQELVATLFDLIATRSIRSSPACLLRNRARPLPCDSGLEMELTLLKDCRSLTI